MGVGGIGSCHALNHARACEINCIIGFICLGSCTESRGVYFILFVGAMQENGNLHARNRKKEPCKTRKKNVNKALQKYLEMRTTHLKR